MEGYFINLESREDRRKHIDNLKKQYPFFKNIQRFNAIKHTNGAIGCTQSHIECLKKLKNTQNEFCLLVEDDFCIFNKHNFKNFIQLFNIIKKDTQWDLITFTPISRIVKDYEPLKQYNIKRTFDTQTTTAYIIRKRFIPILISAFEFGVTKMEEGGKPILYTADRIWKPLQKKHIFLYYQHVFAGQLPGISDIENRVTNYNRRFLLQSKF